MGVLYEHIIAACTEERQRRLSITYTAIRQHGAPEILVSDSGSVFRAKQAQAIYRALGIDKREIARKQPWQNYVETMFAVQRRMCV